MTRVSASEMQVYLDCCSSDNRPTPLLKTADPAQLGIIANESGFLQADGFIKSGNSVMGTLMGKTDELIGGLHIYQAFLLCTDVAPGNRKGRSVGRKNGHIPIDIY